MTKDISASIVLTTIFDPVVLENYYQNLVKFDRLAHTRVYLIPDLKTPDIAYKRCAELKKQGLDIFCPTMEEQVAFLKKVGFDPELIPVNSDNRRNVGFLMALESNSELIISIDDDNFCRDDEDVVGAHGAVCKDVVSTDTIHSKTGWYNICELMEFSPDVKTYARGFPYYARHQEKEVSITQKPVTVRMNAGLWLQDPDVDGISWMVNPAHAISFKGKSITLDSDTWSPVNTQNTALQRDLVSCYYYLKMNYPIGGMNIDRLGDIYSGYFCQACAKAMGHYIRVGSPVAVHRRNAHNYMNDAANEWGGIMVLEDLLPWLTTELKLKGSSYPEVFVCLSECLQEQVERFQGKIWTDSTRAYFHQMAYYMKRWANVCQHLLG